MFELLFLFLVVGGAREQLARYDARIEAGTAGSQDLAAWKQCYAICNWWQSHA